MAMQAHLAELARKHDALERELQRAKAHPSLDELELAELKRRKLALKDEIERLRRDGAGAKPSLH